jgi:regulator of protease activity HflC (stomatin/prohibitin superfamily)
VASSSAHILREYERGVVFRLGRLSELKGPGVVLPAPYVNRLVRVSLRTITLQVPPQGVISWDNVPARVTAAAYFRVVNPNSRSSRSKTCSRQPSQIA